MITEPSLLLAVDRGVTWPVSRGTLRRIPGPYLHVVEGERLVSTRSTAVPKSGRSSSRGRS